MPPTCHLLATYLHRNLIGISSESHRNLIGTSPNDERIFKQLSPKYHLYLQLCLLSSGVPENARGVLGCLTNVIRVFSPPATGFAFASGLANPRLETLHQKKSHIPCAYAIFFVPLQPQTQIGLCRHIIKRRLLALVLVCRNPENFVTQYKRAINVP